MVYTVYSTKLIYHPQSRSLEVCCFDNPLALLRDYQNGNRQTLPLTSTSGLCVCTYIPKSFITTTYVGHSVTQDHSTLSSHNMDAYIPKSYTVNPI